MLKRYWFLFALAAVLALGFTAAEALAPLADAAVLRGAIVFSVLLVMGLTVQPAAAVARLRDPRAAGLGSLVNAGLLPLLGWWVAPYLEGGLAGGLVVAVVVPCTLASASVWTRQAGGDETTAMMVTVLTNLGCFLVAPLWLSVLLERTVDVAFGPQAIKLAGLVVVPLCFAQLLRRLGADRVVDPQRKRLSIAAQLGILAMVLLGASKTGRLLGSDSAPLPGVGDWFAMVVATLGLHVGTLAFGIGLSRWLGWDRTQQIAVGIAGSQKTLMVGLQIAIDCGVSMLPMIVYHVGQLVFDTLVVHWWRERADGPATDPPGGPG